MDQLELQNKELITRVTRGRKSSSETVDDNTLLPLSMRTLSVSSTSTTTSKVSMANLPPPPKDNRISQSRFYTPQTAQTKFAQGPDDTLVGSQK